MTRILIVDDDHAHAALTREAMAPAYREGIVEAHSLAAALAALVHERFDAVILDLNLGDSSGLATLESVLKATPDPAVIVVSNVEDPHLGVKAIAMGAQDYMPKFELLTTFLGRLITHAIARQARVRPTAP